MCAVLASLYMVAFIANVVLRTRHRESACPCGCIWSMEARVAQIWRMPQSGAVLLSKCWCHQASKRVGEGEGDIKQLSTRDEGGGNCKINGDADGHEDKETAIDP